MIELRVLKNLEVGDFCLFMLTVLTDNIQVIHQRDSKNGYISKKINICIS